MIVEEIDELRETRYGWVSEVYNYSKGMKLRLSELDEETYNHLESAASRLHVGVGRLLNEMMEKVVERRDEAPRDSPRYPRRTSPTSGKSARSLSKSATWETSW